METKRATPRDDCGPGSGQTVSKIFLGGLKDGVSDENLKEYFGTFGTVVQVEQMTDKTTGRKRGHSNGNKVEVENGQSNGHTNGDSTNGHSNSDSKNGNSSNGKDETTTTTEEEKTAENNGDSVSPSAVASCCRAIPRPAVLIVVSR